MQSLLAKAANALSGLMNDSPVRYVADRGGLFANHDGAPDGDRAYRAYGSVGTLFAIVSQITNAVASTEWHLYRKTSLRDKTKRQEVLTHPFLTMWDQPNPFYTGRLFRETVQQHMDLVGEGAFVFYFVGNLPVEMWPVRPDRLHPVKHPTKYLTGYMYVGPDGEEVPLETRQVVHIRYPNPSDPYRGMGPVQTVLNDIDAAVYSAQWNRNFFINGARPSGVIKVDYRMSDNEWIAFTNRWRNQHQGVANAHRVAVLENAEWVDTNFTMADMQFVELRNLPRELIREAFAFPKPMLGTVDDVNRANSDAAKEIMAENITSPRLARWRDVINVQILPLYATGANLTMDFDNPVPVNREAEDRARDSKTKGAVALRNAGWNPDDVLEAMELPYMRYDNDRVTNAPAPAQTEEPPNADEKAPTNKRRLLQLADY